MNHKKCFTQRELSTVGFVSLVLMVFVMALTRLLPHPPNFTPLIASALFGGAYCNRRFLAFAIPIGAMFVSDVGLEILTGYGFHRLMFVVYGSIALIVAMGFVLRRHLSVRWIAGMTVGASLLFFISTNFFVWLMSGLYPKTFDGLMACYVAALPFFGRSILGDLFYAGIMFGGWAFAESRWPVFSVSCLSDGFFSRPS